MMCWHIRRGRLGVISRRSRRVVLERGRWVTQGHKVCTYSLSISFTLSVLSVLGHKKMSKTYNSGYSLVVTHLTTNPPVRCLNSAERTGSLVFNVLWLYVEASG
jgi:hypothetical protein